MTNVTNLSTIKDVLSFDGTAGNFLPYSLSHLVFIKIDQCAIYVSVPCLNSQFDWLVCRSLRGLSRERWNMRHVFIFEIRTLFSLAAITLRGSLYVPSPMRGILFPSLSGMEWLSAVSSMVIKCVSQRMSTLIVDTVEKVTQIFNCWDSSPVQRAPYINLIPENSVQNYSKTIKNKEK